LYDLNKRKPKVCEALVAQET